MNLQHDAGGIVDAGLLVRHLHGELDADDARAVAGHLATCAPCRSFAALLASRAHGVRDALRAADFDEPGPEAWRALRTTLRAGPPAPHRIGRLAVAAVCVLVAVAAAGMASASARTWVVERWARLAGESAPAADADGKRAGRAELTFRPIGSDLQITFETTQVDGMLTLRFTDARTATVSVDGGGTEQLSVGERGVHVANDGESFASFRVTLPVGVERVRVSIGAVAPIDVLRSVVREDAVGITLDRAVVVRNPPARDDQ